jgi:hypothetical protein
LKESKFDRRLLVLLFKTHFLIEDYYILMMTDILMVSANVFDMKNIGVVTPTLQEWSESKA